VPASYYLKVTTFAGDGKEGFVDGTGTAASLSSPIGIAIDQSNNLYVTNWFLDGIPYYNDLIRKITPAAVVTTLAGNNNEGYTNGQGAAAQFQAESGTAVDPDGNVYVADVDNNVIRKITPTGLVTTYAGSGVAGYVDGDAKTAMFSAPVAVCIDGARNLYVADYTNAMIRKITPGGVVSTLAGGGPGYTTDGTGANAAFKGPQGVAVDNDGNVWVADAGGNTIRKVTALGVVTTFAGSGVGSALDGQGRAATFFRPIGITLDRAGNIYVADAQNDLIRKITPAGKVTTLAGTGAPGKADGTGRAASFYDPEGLAINSLGELFIGDKGNNLVRKMILTGYTISPALPAGLNFDVTSGIISGTPTATSPTTTYTITGYNVDGSSTAQVTITVTGENGIPPVAPPVISYATPQVYKVNLTLTPLLPNNTGGAVPQQVYGGVTIFAGSGRPGATNDVGALATFTSPNGTAVDVAGNVYVADQGNNIVRKITPAGVVTTLAGSGSTGSSDGPGTSASFNAPQAVAVDGAGNVYVADFGNNAIRKITPAGQVSTFAYCFKNPAGLAVDAVGDVFVADRGNNIIKKVTLAGVTSVFAGSGSPGAADGVGTAASFNLPAGVAVDGAGYVYVADAGNNLIRKITPGGLVSTVAGSGSAGYADGVGAAASFKFPAGITFDAIGNMYVADTGNDLIRKITPAGVVTTLAGSAGNPGRGNGQGTATSFNTPSGISIDANGDLYIGDVVNNLIREVSTNGYTISPVLPAGISFDSKTGTISGTPTAASPATNYTVTAYNGGGSGSCTINITVENPIIITVNPPSISYVTPQDYVINSPIIALEPANTGGDVPATIYGQVSTFAGSGSPGAGNGLGAGASFSALHGAVSDLVGNVYFCDNNLIREISPSGMVSTMAGSGAAGSADGQGTAASFNQPLGITVDNSGNVYVADTKNNTIRMITQAGKVTTVAGIVGSAGLVNGGTSVSKFNAPSGIAIDQEGNLFIADAGNNVIREISSFGIVSTFAGTGSMGSANGSAIGSSFNNPLAITIDQKHNVFVADAGNNLIRKISASDIVSSFAVGFNNPCGVSADVVGNVYVADTGNDIIWKISPTGTLSTLSGTGKPGAVNGDLDVASFNKPYGIAADIFGDIYVADQNNNLTRKIVTTGYTIDQPLPAGLTFDGKTGFITGTPTVISPATNYTVTAYNTGGSSVTVINIEVSKTISPIVPKPNISYNPDSVIYLVNRPIVPLVPKNTGGILPTKTFGLTSTVAGTGNPGMADGTGKSASFNQPFGVATDPTGNLYVVDHLNNTIRKITPAGVVSTIAGSGSIGRDNGVGTAASFNNPTGIAVDRGGNIYVADVSNNMIRKITPGGVVTTLAGSGATGSADGLGSAATFNNPSGIAVDAAGNVYVADLSNNRIRKITAGGLVSTIAGSGFVGSADGTGAAATFNQPYGLAVDITGTLFVTDWGNDLIRKITPDGVVTTIAGTGQPGSADGQGTAASFNQPFGIAVDEAGNIYIADTGNEKIREISPTGLVTTVAGNGNRGKDDGIGGTTTFYQPTGVVSDGAGDVYIADEFNQLIREIVTISDYTIDKALPAGLTFDRSTGTIAGTPTVVTAAQTYTVTAYNEGGSSSTPVIIGVVEAPPVPQIITFNPITTKTYGDPAFAPVATSSDTTIAITYTSSDPGVATIVNGQIQITGAGITIITANQPADSVYSAAPPVTQTLTVMPAPLVGTVDDKSRPYESKDPPFTVTFTGFVYEDGPAQLTGKPVITTTAVASSPAGPYPITASGDVSPNYTVTYIPGILTVTPVPSQIIIPNAFTPNGDGINDFWDIKNLDEFPDPTVSVYNRYGLLVYHSNGYPKPWDGTYNGSLLPVGVYYYIINPKNGLQQVAGNVTILR
jgi:gliding motility-associated-like protein